MCCEGFAAEVEILLVFDGLQNTVTLKFRHSLAGVDSSVVVSWLNSRS